MMLALGIAALVITILGGMWWFEMDAARLEIRRHSLRRRREVQEEMRRLG